MPMPTGGEWPPPALKPIQNKLTTWSAWYSGDTDQLAAVYGGAATSDPSGTGFFASERGGWRAAVGNTLHRWFWGTRAPANTRQNKLHVPIASDVAATSADLLFSEPPTFTAENPKAQERIDELVDDGLQATLLEAAEICAALGGVYLRVVWDRDLADQPWLSAVHPDAAIPVWRWNKLVEVTFWRVVADDGRTVLRHLEHHEPGAIRHALYQGTEDELGRAVPLTEHADTAGLAEVLVDGDTVVTGVEQLTAVYVPNMRPNRIWRNIPAAAALGRSDFAGAELLMDALDQTYTSWMRDVRLAKARLIVPSTYLQSNGPGAGASFDLDREVYEAINMLGGEDRMEITPQQFAIRVDEHERTALNLFTRIVATCGYSGQTFGLNGEAAATATEVVARERRSMITRDRKGRYWRPALGDALEVLLAVDRAQFSGSAEPERPDVDFGDSVSEDRETVARTLQLLEAAQSASTETKVRILWPDWDDKQVAKEVEAIKGGAAPPPEETLGALAGNAPPGAPPVAGDEPLEEEVPAEEA